MSGEKRGDDIAACARREKEIVSLEERQCQLQALPISQARDDSPVVYIVIN
jgi:hypothetical protein